MKIQHSFIVGITSTVISSLTPAFSQDSLIDNDATKQPRTISAGLTIFHFAYAVSSEPQIQLFAGPLVQLHGERDESDSDTLNGLGNIDRSAAVGGFIEFNADSWSSNIRFSPQDVGDEVDGLLVGLDVLHISQISNKLTISQVFPQTG